MKFPAKILSVLGLALALMSISGAKAHAQVIAVKTNVLEIAALTPNLGVETVTGERTSIDVSLMGHSKPYGLPSKLISLQPEFRFWLSGRPMINAFVGITAQASMHQVTLRDQFCEGASFGLGPTAGYVLALGRKWNVEFTGGMAVSYFFQKQYSVKDSDYIIPPTVSDPNSRGYRVLPIDLGITLTYILR